jgi:hypothetical protein
VASRAASRIPAVFHRVKSLTHRADVGDLVGLQRPLLDDLAAANAKQVEAVVLPLEVQQRRAHVLLRLAHTASRRAAGRGANHLPNAHLRDKAGPRRRVGASRAPMADRELLIEWSRYPRATEQA